MFPNDEFTKEIRNKYPRGTRIQLDFMDDPRAIPSGTKGTVDHVDDAAQVHVKWDNGRTLAVIPGEDSFHKITERSRDEGR